jgi:hypothetical protein
MASRFLFTAPTPKRDWVKAGDTCESQMGMRGEVLLVRELSSLPYAKIRWENGHVSRETITTVRKAAPR